MAHMASSNSMVLFFDAPAGCQHTFLPAISSHQHSSHQQATKGIAGTSPAMLSLTPWVNCAMNYCINRVDFAPLEGSEKRLPIKFYIPEYYQVSEGLPGSMSQFKILSIWSPRIYILIILLSIIKTLFPVINHQGCLLIKGGLF